MLDLTNDRYSKGAIDYFDVVNAERSLLAIQLGAAQTLNARYAATVALVRALGGGWEEGAVRTASVGMEARQPGLRHPEKEVTVPSAPGRRSFGDDLLD